MYIWIRLSRVTQRERSSRPAKSSFGALQKIRFSINCSTASDRLIATVDRQVSQQLFPKHPPASQSSPGAAKRVALPLIPTCYPTPKLLRVTEPHGTGNLSRYCALGHLSFSSCFSLAIPGCLLCFVLLFPSSSSTLFKHCTFFQDVWSSGGERGSSLREGEDNLWQRAFRFNQMCCKLELPVEASRKETKAPHVSLVRGR